MRVKTESVKALLIGAFLAFLSMENNAAVHVASDSECTASLDFINAIEEGSDEAIFRTYILCPNTEYKFADVHHKGQLLSAGQGPLLLSKSNIRVQCGKDGSSSNNCILSGGFFQLGFYRADSDTNKQAPILSAFVQGLTFKSAQAYNVLIEHTGSITITDCIFRDNLNRSPIFATVPVDEQSFHRRVQALDRGELSVEEVLRSRATRGRQEKQVTELHVTIKKSLFLDNTLSALWEGDGPAVEGLATFDSALVRITDSIFAGTKKARENVLGYLIRVEHGDLIMNTNCFIGNDERIAPVIMNRGNAFESGSFVQRRQATIAPTSCEFVATVTRGSLENESTFECIEPSTPAVCEAVALNKFLVKLPCEESLDKIYANEEDTEIEDFVRTYILCPHTEYKIGSLKGTMFNEVDGSAPIVIGRPNFHVICGADGKSSNGCVLVGGAVQLGVLDEFRSSGVISAATNALVQGLTFTGATSTNILAQFPSELILRDCIFQNNENVASIYLGVPESRYGGYRQLVTDSRRAMTNEGNLLVTVVDSTFAANAVGSQPGHNTGIIISHEATLRVLDSTFMGTTDVKADLKYASYVIGNVNGTLELVGNCFLRNDIEFATVFSHSDHLPTLSNNFGSTSASTKTICDFAAVAVTYSASTQGTRKSSFSCIDFTGPSCFSEPGPVAVSTPPPINIVDTVQFKTKSMSKGSPNMLMASCACIFGLAAVW